MIFEGTKKLIFFGLGLTRAGRTHPTGPVFRLLDILSKSEEMEYIVAK